MHKDAYKLAMDTLGSNPVSNTLTDPALLPANDLSISEPPKYDHNASQSVKVKGYPVNDAGGMQVLDATQHLVEQVGQPLVVQLHLDDLAQVGVHQLHHQVPG